MIYFLLPTNHHPIYKSIDCVTSDVVTEPIISNSLLHYLYDTKEKINSYEQDWDLFKKYTNPYEYIHSPIPTTKKAVSKYKPLSRSYFKMIEIMSIFKIGQAEHAAPIRSFHLAEGPGGFIEALANLRLRSDDQYVGMTILDGKSDHNIPAWKKSTQFLATHPNVFIENGADGTGNLLSLENFGYCAEKYKSSIDIITADGGFDFSDDFNSQEMTIVKLLFAQICFAVTMQKKNGCFILKVFDCFMQHTVDLLYILSSFYDRVYITKPQTSRYANSEKYIVCKHFTYKSNAEFYPHLHKAFANMMEDRKHVSRFLRIPIPTFFLNKLEEYNSIFGQQQIENIQNTIILIENKHKNERIENLLKMNIQKSTNWCIKYAVPHYAIIKPPNIFLDEFAHVNKFITPLNGRIVGAL